MEDFFEFRKQQADKNPAYFKLTYGDKSFSYDFREYTLNVKSQDTHLNFRYYDKYLDDDLATFVRVLNIKETGSIEIELCFESGREVKGYIQPENLNAFWQSLMRRFNQDMGKMLNFEL